jgi:hypothetical protein
VSLEVALYLTEFTTEVTKKHGEKREEGKDER